MNWTSRSLDHSLHPLNKFFTCSLPLYLSAISNFIVLTCLSIFFILHLMFPKPRPVSFILFHSAITNLPLFIFYIQHYFYFLSPVQFPSTLAYYRSYAFYKMWALYVRSLLFDILAYIGRQPDRIAGWQRRSNTFIVRSSRRMNRQKRKGGYLRIALGEQKILQLPQRLETGNNWPV